MATGGYEKKQRFVNQMRGPNFRDKQGNLFLVRCYACEPNNGTENYAMSVSSGQCAWCGYYEKKEEEK